MWQWRRGQGRQQHLRQGQQERNDQRKERKEAACLPDEALAQSGEWARCGRSRERKRGIERDLWNRRSPRDGMSRLRWLREGSRRCRKRNSHPDRVDFHRLPDPSERLGRAGRGAYRAGHTAPLLRRHHCRRAVERQRRWGFLSGRKRNSRLRSQYCRHHRSRGVPEWYCHRRKKDGREGLQGKDGVTGRKSLAPERERGGRRSWNTERHQRKRKKRTGEEGRRGRIGQPKSGPDSGNPTCRNRHRGRDDRCHTARKEKAGRLRSEGTGWSHR